VEELLSITPQCNRGLLRVINSRKVNDVLGKLGLAGASRYLKSAQERAWLGWTLICLARKRAENTRLS
jgi:hypothetical protein